MTLYPLWVLHRHLLLVCFPWVDHKEQVSSGKAIWWNLGTELRHRSWAVHRLNTWGLLKSWMWSRVRGWDPAWSFPHLCVPVWSWRVKNLSLMLHIFMLIYCQDKSREHILCNSLLAWYINFEYLDSKCLESLFVFFLSLAYVIGYKTEIINTSFHTSWHCRLIMIM